MNEFRGAVTSNQQYGSVSNQGWFDKYVKSNKLMGEQEVSVMTVIGGRVTEVKTAIKNAAVIVNVRIKKGDTRPVTDAIPGVFMLSEAYAAVLGLNDSFPWRNQFRPEGEQMMDGGKGKLVPFYCKTVCIPLGSLDPKSPAPGDDWLITDTSNDFIQAGQTKARDRNLDDVVQMYMGTMGGTAYNIVRDFFEAKESKGDVKSQDAKNEISSTFVWNVRVFNALLITMRTFFENPAHDKQLKMAKALEQNAQPQSEMERSMTLSVFKNTDVNPYVRLIEHGLKKWRLYNDPTKAKICGQYSYGLMAALAVIPALRWDQDEFAPATILDNLTKLKATTSNVDFVRALWSLTPPASTGFDLSSEQVQALHDVTMRSPSHRNQVSAPADIEVDFKIKVPEAKQPPFGLQTTGFVWGSVYEGKSTGATYYVASLSSPRGEVKSDAKGGEVKADAGTRAIFKSSQPGGFTGLSFTESGRYHIDTTMIAGAVAEVQDLAAGESGKKMTASLQVSFGKCLAPHIHSGNPVYFSKGAFWPQTDDLEGKVFKRKPSKQVSKLDLNGGFVLDIDYKSYVVRVTHLAAPGGVDAESIVEIPLYKDSAGHLPVVSVVGRFLELAVSKV